MSYIIQVQVHAWVCRRGWEGGEELPVPEEMGFHAMTWNYKWLQLEGRSISGELEGRKVQFERNGGQSAWPLAEALDRQDPGYDVGLNLVLQPPCRCG